MRAPFFAISCSKVMDPLTALGLTANIAQFIDFGSRLIHQTKEVALTSTTISIEHQLNITSNLTIINSSLEQYQMRSS